MRSRIGLAFGAVSPYFEALEVTDALLVPRDWLPTGWPSKIAHPPMSNSCLKHRFTIPSSQFPPAPSFQGLLDLM